MSTKACKFSPLLPSSQLPRPRTCAKDSSASSIKFPDRPRVRQGQQYILLPRSPYCKRLESIHRFDNASKTTHTFRGRPAATAGRRISPCYSSLARRLLWCSARCSSLALLSRSPRRLPRSDSTPASAPFRWSPRRHVAGAAPPHRRRAATPQRRRWPRVCGAGSIASSRSRPGPGSAPLSPPPGPSKYRGAGQACGGLGTVTGLLPRPTHVSAQPPLCVTQKEGSTNAFCRCKYTAKLPPAHTQLVTRTAPWSTFPVTRHFRFCGRQRGEGELGGCP